MLEFDKRDPCQCRHAGHGNKYTVLQHYIMLQTAALALNQVPAVVMSQGWYGHRSNGCWIAPTSTSSRCKLAGVKHTLYHPLQPTLRRMEMDSVAHKLSEEHSRTSTPLTQDNFRNASFTSVAAPDCRLPSLEITDTGRQIAKRFATGTMAPLPQSTSQEEWSSFTNAATDWSQCSSSSGEFQVKDLKKQVLGYRGYAVCLLPTDGTRSWKYCLQQNPSLDKYGPSPVPVETLNTYRSPGNLYSWNSSIGDKV
uniref:TEPP protein n=2 Tax=Xenopus tropicalis TaxID=8364 RepID=A0A803JK94_XENTR